jgi:hypothetical protein
MGHVRLGSLPQTKPWRQVVELVSDGSTEVAAVAAATMRAADRGLEVAATDAGMRHSIWLLAQITLAAREDNFSSALSEIGVRVPDSPSVFDIVGGFSESVDRALNESRDRTDIGEMAQMAAAETLTSLCSAKSQSLFGTSPEDVKEAVRSFSTKNGFSDLSHDFFSRFTQKYLMYHLSRELPRHVGSGERFQDPREHSDFIQSLETHCRQAALIVKDFSGGWYSKTNYESGITHLKARNFAHVAMKKMRAELRRRGGADGN